MLINRLAVLLCGEYRTWDRTKDNIFKYIDTLSDNVDYYFVTWSASNPSRQNCIERYLGEWKDDASLRQITSNDIIESFKLKNLIDFKIVDIKKSPSTLSTFYNQAYLAKVANLLKRKHEFVNKFVYDQVIELRPDLYIPHHYTKPELCEDFEYIISSLTKAGFKIPHMRDFYFRTNSATSDIMSNRFYHKKFIELEKIMNSPIEELPLVHIPSSHYYLVDYTFSRRLESIDHYKNNSVVRDEIVNTIPFRPNFPDNVENLDNDELLRLNHEWIKMIDNIK